MGSLILLIVVIFIFKTLFANFGFTSSDSKKDSKEDEAIKEFLKQNFEKNKKDCTIKNIQVVDITNGQDNGNYVSLDDQENIFNNKEIFLKQVEKVVEVVVSEFANGNKMVLRNLLTDKLFSTFSIEIDKNLAKNLSLKSVIVSFDNKEFLSNFGQNQNTVSVSLNMKQINYIEDENHNVIHGDKNNPVTIKEIWTFVRNNDLNAPSPWLVNSIAEY